MSRRSLQAGAGCRAEQARAQKQRRLPGDLCSGRERITERRRLLLQVLQRSLADPFVLLCGTNIVGGDTVFAPVVPSAGDLVRGGHECLGGATSAFHAPRKGAKRTVGAPNGLCSHPESWGGPVAIFHGTAFEALAAGEGIRGGEAEPGATGFVIGPRVPIGANLGQQRLRQGRAEPMDGHEVHARDAEEVRAGVPLRGVFTVRLGVTTWRRGRTCGPGGLARARSGA